MGERKGNRHWENEQEKKKGDRKRIGPKMSV